MSAFERERIRQNVQGDFYATQLRGQANNLLSFYDLSPARSSEESDERQMQIPFLQTICELAPELGDATAEYNKEITLQKLATLWRSTVYAYQYTGLRNGQLRLPSYGSEVTPIVQGFRRILQDPACRREFGESILRYPSVSMMERYSPLPVIFHGQEYTHIDIGAASHIGIAGQEIPANRQELQRLMEQARVHDEPGTASLSVGYDLQPLDDDWVRACSYYIGAPIHRDRERQINDSMRMRDQQPERFLRRQANIFKPWTRLPVWNRFDVATTFFVTHMNYTLEKWTKVMGTTLREGGVWLHLGTESMVSPDEGYGFARYPLTAYRKIGGKLQEIGPVCWFHEDQRTVLEFNPDVMAQLR